MEASANSYVTLWHEIKARASRAVLNTVSSYVSAAPRRRVNRSPLSRMHQRPPAQGRISPDGCNWGVGFRVIFSLEDKQT